MLARSAVAPQHGAQADAVDVLAGRRRRGALPSNRHGGDLLGAGLHGGGRTRMTHFLGYAGGEKQAEPTGRDLGPHIVDQGIPRRAVAIERIGVHGDEQGLSLNHSLAVVVVDAVVAGQGCLPGGLDRHRAIGRRRHPS